MKMRKQHIVFASVILILAGIVCAFLKIRQVINETNIEKSYANSAEDIYHASDVNNALADVPAVTISQVKPAESCQPQIQPLPQIDPQAKEKQALSKVLTILTGRSTTSGLSDQEIKKLLAALLDNTQPLKARRQAAWLAAKYGNSQAWDTLEKLLAEPNAAPQLKAAIVEAMAHSGNPRNKDAIKTVLDSNSSIVACSAIKRLAVIGDRESIQVLSDIAQNPQNANAFRLEAVTGLGQISDEQAYQVLVGMYKDPAIKDDELRNEIISSLGQNDIAKTQPFFSSLLQQNSDDASGRLKVAEAIENSKGDVSPFALTLLNDSDSEVRQAAAWAIASAEQPGNVGKELEAILANEPDGQVRKRLYQALSNQENADADSIYRIAQNETDSEARAQAYDFLARKVAESGEPSLKIQFDTLILPQLRQTALAGETLQSKLDAVIALKNANTDASRYALKEIADQAADIRVAAATGIKK